MSTHDGTAPTGRGQSPGMLLLLRAVSQDGRHFSRLLQLAQLGERLDQIGGYGKGPGVADSLALGVLPDGAELLHCLAGLAAQELQHPERPPDLEEIPPTTPVSSARAIASAAHRLASLTDPDPLPVTRDIARTSAREATHGQTRSAHSSSLRSAASHSPARSSSSHR